MFFWLKGKNMFKNKSAKYNAEPYLNVANVSHHPIKSIDQTAAQHLSFFELNTEIQNGGIVVGYDSTCPHGVH